LLFNFPYRINLKLAKETQMRFENQVALVTGAASGIGHALVHQFVREGAAVVAVDLAEESLNRVVAELQARAAKPPVASQTLLRMWSEC
jgi:NAD(P)-dependent dehydrogenase (short-subunit alcohol dehydrogenase family)